MQIAILAALAAGFAVSFRFGPISVVPLAAAAVIIALFCDATIAGSRFLASAIIVVALNAGYLLGAVLCWWLGSSRKP